MPKVEAVVDIVRDKDSVPAVARFQSESMHFRISLDPHDHAHELGWRTLPFGPSTAGAHGGRGQEGAEEGKPHLRGDLAAVEAADDLIRDLAGRAGSVEHDEAGNPPHPLALVSGVAVGSKGECLDRFLTRQLSDFP
jgi:hypothetical protein